MRILLTLLVAVNVAGCAALFALITFMQDRRARGRLIVRPLARRLRMSPRDFRNLLMLATIILWCVTLPADLLLDDAQWARHAVLAFGIALPSIDDVVTGGPEGRWKRRLAAARNKIRWRMHLPRVPSPTGGTA